MKDNKYTEQELADLACNFCDGRCSTGPIGSGDWCDFIVNGIEFMRKINLVRTKEKVLYLKTDYVEIIHAQGYEKDGNKFIHDYFPELNESVLKSYEGKELSGISQVLLPCMVEWKEI